MRPRKLRLFPSQVGSIVAASWATRVRRVTTTTALLASTKMNAKMERRPAIRGPDASIREADSDVTARKTEAPANAPWV